jgi:hypothetical protein
MPTQHKLESDEEDGFVTQFGTAGKSCPEPSGDIIPVLEEGSASCVKASYTASSKFSSSFVDNNNESATEKHTVVNKEKPSQQYYDTETGGDEIVAVETDQDNNKPSTSRSLPNTSSSGGGIDWSGCCDTTNKKWAWCAMFTVVLIVSIGVLAASLKKLNSTEVSIATTTLFMDIECYLILTLAILFTTIYMYAVLCLTVVWSRVQYSLEDSR